MSSRIHHASVRAAHPAGFDAPAVPLLDSSFLPAEEDWSVVGHARAYHDAHTDLDEAGDLDFAIEQGALD